MADFGCISGCVDQGKLYQDRLRVVSLTGRRRVLDYGCMRGCV